MKKVIKKQNKFQETTSSQMLFPFTRTVRLTNGKNVNIQIHMRDHDTVEQEIQEIADKIMKALNN